MGSPNHTRGAGGAIVALLLIAGCASTPDAPPRLPPEPGEHGAIDARGRLQYAGMITPSANAVVMESFDRAEVKPQTLLITSPGGGIVAGMDLGEWILDNQLDVEIGGLCFSSCANYVFVAGATKILRSYSLLGWHGSAFQEEWDTRADPEHPEYSPAFAETRARESRFYDRIGVDNVITLYYFDHDVSVFSWRGFRHTVLSRRGPISGWYYSLEDLERMGVRNVVLADGEWAWQEYWPRDVSQVWLISLEDDYEFTSSRFALAPADP